VTTPDHDLTALFERAADAVAFGELEALRALLDAQPALVFARSARPHQATLLHYCAANGTEDPRQRTPPNAPAIAQLLLERGADPNAECTMYGAGDTTLYLLLTSAFPAEAGLDGELVRVLARAGARLDSAQGRSAMLEAIQYARPRSVDALVEAGEPVADLLVAAAAERVDQIASLLAAGADVNTRFGDGWTALHAAAVTGRVRAVELLLLHGADSSLREERFDGTAAGNARYNGFDETAALIERARPGTGDRQSG
jgi:ankyrin repeat protein